MTNSDTSMSRARRLAALGTAAVTVAALATAAGTSGASATTSAPRTAASLTATATLTTSYAIPSGAVFVSTSGSNTAAGSQSSPLRTLAAAIAKAPAGGTVVMRGGVYREGSAASVYKKLTIQSFPGERVWLDGTDVVSTGWTAAGTAVWARSWSTPSFCDGKYYTYHYRTQSTGNTGPCTHKDMAKDPANPAAGDPQMVFLNGKHVREVVTRAGVVAGTFFYDWAAKKIYLGADPAANRVELAARPVALVIQGGDGFTIRGIGFRRYATNEYNANRTHGAVLAGSPNIVIERSVFSENAGAGLSYAKARGGVVRNSLFVNNGFNGLDVNGASSSTTTADNFLLENSRFDGNNRELFGAGCSASCAAAGSKMAHMNGATIRGNIFENTRGSGKGYWCDLDCSRTVIVNNTVRNNGDVGIFWEVSDTGIIASNLIYGNKDYGIKSGSANTKIHNNTIAHNAKGLLIFDDDRSPGYNGWDSGDVGPNTKNVTMVNNIVASNGGTPLKLWRTSTVNGNTGPNYFMTTLDFNSYQRTTAGSGLVEWKESTTSSLYYKTIAALRTAKGKELNGWETIAAGDAFFVDAAARNYTLRSGSPAKGNGKALPADVAAAVGVPAGVVVDRGVLVNPNVAPAPPVVSTPAPVPTPTQTLTPSPAPTPTATSTPESPAVTAPTLTALPASGATVSGVVKLTAAAGGAGIAKAELFLGRSLAHSFPGAGPYAFGFDSRRVADGSVVKVTWTITDNTGRTASVVSYLTVDN